MASDNKVTIYTSVNSGGFDVQVWADGRCIWSERYSTRKKGHLKADEWLDTSKYSEAPRDHQL